MADGIPTVMPDAGAAPFQHTSASSAAFGGATAQAMEGLGNTVVKVAEYFGEVQIDDQANQLFDRWNKRLRGDPEKMVPGPDGTIQPDTGYMGLKGRNALDARGRFEKDLDADLKEIRATLVTPRQQARFDDQTRRYRQHVVGLAGSHADREAQTYATNVNRSSSAIAMQHIAVNALDATQVAAGTADLISARIKEAQIMGGGPELLKAAEQGAKRDALKVQVQAISATDPARALQILDKNKDIAGTSYDELHREIRARADTEIGNRAGERAILATYQMEPAPATVIPVFEQAAAQTGVSSTYLMRTWQLEAGGKMDPGKSVTGAEGPFQFVPSTAKQYGLSNPRDFSASAAAAAKLAADNRAMLGASLGRVPTDAELYLAHQQGATGAAKLLSNPTARAGDLVGDKAIKVNGGDPNAPASAFTGMWAARFNGAGVMTANMTARKQQAFDSIESDPSLNDAQRQRARSYLNQQFSALQIAQGVSAQAEKQRVDAAADGYMKRILSKNPAQMAGIYEEITTDPAFGSDWRTRNALAGMAQKAVGDDTQAATEAYGPGFWEAWKAVTAPVDDPKRIVDRTALYERAGPGGDLTIAGAEKLAQTMEAVKKSPDAQAVHTTQTALMAYAKGKLSFAQDMGPIKIPDPKGEAIFNGEFIPKFQAAYAEWIKAGKNPWEFLKRENIDQMIQGMRPKGEMEVDRLAATGEVAPEAPAPSPPDGIDKARWNDVMGMSLSTSTGKPFPKAAWGQAVTWLLQNPTPEGVKLFNESKFGRTAKIDGQKLLERLGVGKTKAPVVDSQWTP